MKRRGILLRKIIGAMTAVCMAAVLGTAVSAQTTESEGLQDAILTAKKIITVPKEYKDFTYSMKTSEDIGVKTNVWYLRWTTQDEGNSINAAVDTQGNLVYFDQYDRENNWNGQKLAAVSWEEGKKNASLFLQKAMPSAGAYSHMRLEPQSYASSTAGAHIYQYRYYANDIPVNFLTASVQVDKMTGKVTQYAGFQAGSAIPSFPVLEGLIGQDGAKAAYLDKAGVTLGYYSDFDEKTKKLTVFPAYQAEGDSETVIDAKTGEKKTAKFRQRGNGIFEDLSAGEAAAAYARDLLTKEEKEAISKVSGLLTQQEAEKAFRAIAPNMKQEQKLNSATLSRQRVDQDRFVWNLNFEEMSGSVDAKSGSLLSFYANNFSSDNQTADRGTAQQKAEEFLQKAAPEEWKQVKLSPVLEEQRPASSQRFIYYRQANGVDYYNNSLSVTVMWDGSIRSYSKTWYTSAQFPSIEKAMSREQAFDYLNQKGRMGLSYEYEAPGKVILAYGMQSAVYQMLTDPFTGAALSRDGSPYHDVTLPAYTDLAGHWSEAAVKTLLENGYYLEGNQFRPDQAITKAGFFRYLYTSSFLDSSDEEMGEALIQWGIVKKGEWNPSQPLSREDAARYFVRYLGLDKAAQIDGIYRPLFQDAVSEGYQGYVSLCIGLNILPTQDGKFYGGSIMTNATAAQAIYQLLRSL